jgi:DNA mismatch repair ATPase MutS
MVTYSTWKYSLCHLTRFISGGFIEKGYNEQLDEQHLLRDNGQSLMNDLQTQYRSSTGISSLKGINLRALVVTAVV